MGTHRFFSVDCDSLGVDKETELMLVNDHLLWRLEMPTATEHQREVSEWS